MIEFVGLDEKRIGRNPESAFCSCELGEEGDLPCQIAEIKSRLKSVLNYRLQPRKQSGVSRTDITTKLSRIYGAVIRFLKPWKLILGLLIWIVFYASNVSAQFVKDINVEALASAIKKAESSKNHPYGILAPYCAGQTPQKCRKGCVQTIQKRLRLWTGKEDFISFLSRTYAPIGAENDPRGLNRNWTSNVSHFYAKEISQ